MRKFDDVTTTSYDKLMVRLVRCESSMTWLLPLMINLWYALYNAKVQRRGYYLL